jgi:hypothetical protein
MIKIDIMADWGRSGGIFPYRNTSDDVGPIYRLLATICDLKLCSMQTFWQAASRQKVAKMAIRRLMETGLI